MAESWNPPVYVPPEDDSEALEEFVYESTLFNLGLQCFRVRYDGSVPVKVYDMLAEYHTNVGYYIVPDNVWADAGTLSKEQKALAEKLIMIHIDSILPEEDEEAEDVAL